MSNLKKLLALESKLEELVKPKVLHNIGLVIPPQTKEEVFKKMIQDGLAEPNVTIDDIYWVNVAFVSAPPRDNNGKLITNRQLL